MSPHNPSFVAIVTCLYLATAAQQAWHSRWPEALIWFSYAFANIGFIWMMVSK